jgi:hypothetical protein
MKRRVTAWAVTLACIAGPSFAASPVQSYQEARRVLDAGIKAAGGLEALREIKDVSREATGTAYAQGQSLQPDQPLLARAIELQLFQDFAGGRSATLFTQTGAGVLPTKTRTVAIENGFSYNLISKVATPMTAGALTASRNNLRRDPAVLLLTALDRAETLRSLGDDTIDGKRHQLVTFSTADGAQVALAFDAASGLLSRVQTLADNAVLGDALTETLLSDYQEAAVGTKRVKLPNRMVTHVAGETTQDLKFGKVVVNGGPASGLLDPPSDAETVPAAPPGAGVTLTKLGDDAYFATGGSHHSLFVVFNDHVVVLEAPLNEERSLAVLAKIEETAPGKPVRYVVPTHYHFDHSGGLRTYIAKGITIVTTPGNKAFIERLAKTPHTIKPDSPRDRNLHRQARVRRRRAHARGARHRAEPARRRGGDRLPAEAEGGVRGGSLHDPAAGAVPAGEPGARRLRRQDPEAGARRGDDRSRPRSARHARGSDGGAGGEASLELAHGRYSLRSARMGSTRAAASAGTRLAAAATRSRIAAARAYASGSSGLTP